MDSETAYATLTKALNSHGLSVSARPEGGLVVRNLSSHPGGDGGRELPYLLRQEVVCAPHGSGGLWWFWVWTGLERGDPPEFEALCPAADVVLAAERIGRVVALPSPGVGA